MSLTDSNRELTWRRSRRSISNGACVEVAPNDGMVIVRDSNNADGAIIKYAAADWRIFLERAKRGEFDTLSKSNKTTVYRASPRNQFGTANLRDFLLDLIDATTQNDEALRRHLELFRFARSTIREVVAAVIVGSLIFGAGVAAAVTVGGMHVAVAVSIGAGGSATFILTVAVRCRRYLRAALSALSATARHDKQTQPRTAEADDRTAALQRKIPYAPQLSTAREP